MWHKVQESYKLKPKLEAHSSDQEFVDAVNAVRGADGLNLEKFTPPKDKMRLRLKKSRTPSTPYEDALYNVTCAQIEEASIDPKVEDHYTLIYAVKDDAPPTAAEAVDFWKTGYNELGPDVPPAFKAKVEMRAETADGEIYYDNAVAGFVSLMVDAAREMRCYNATGCSKAAVICFLSAPTLVEGEKPISATTWQKILTLDSNDNYDKSMKFVKLRKEKLQRLPLTAYLRVAASITASNEGQHCHQETENCLTEINEFRTQDGLGLNAFVAKTSSSTDSGADGVTTRASEALEMLTCDALKSGNAPFLSTLTKRSLMYYSGSSTCSDAVTEWKKGYDKFKDLTIPPAYTSSETMYKTGAATNFISLVSEGKETAATCYRVDGCTDPGLVCVLEPAVFEDGKSPITEATWQKVTTTFSNGASATSVYGALLSSVLVVVALFAFIF
ncbi:SAG family member [Eimeria maxima]|uniref:SAG family member n=1 Tax=Eimeria maxima TaxID=5804 RepID=U6MJ24_EIMMA|nr:SAG family member [Eimeria maxima]CDJ61645.1 SAG family member [Eimeria maxima]